MNKDFIKRARRAIARWAYYFFSFLFRILPYPVIKAITGLMLPMAYVILKRLRKNALETLRIAFGNERSAEELERICKDCFYNIGKIVIEIGVFNTRPKELVKHCHLDPVSRQNLDSALNEGRGVVGVSAHFGNFPLMLLYLSQIGYPTNAIIRPSRDKKIEVSFQKARARMGFKTIHSYPRESCVLQSLKCLRQKELLVVLMDQNTGSKSGVYVDFFGQKAGTPTGAIIFAMRTNSPIVPIFTIRDGYDTHRIVVEPHFYIETKATDEETLTYNVQRITNSIERYIRQYPQEWGWMHKRFKSKPNNE